MKTFLTSFKHAWDLITGLKNAVGNVLFILTVGAVGAFFMWEPRSPVADSGSLLLMRIEGRVVDAQPSAGRRLQALRQMVAGTPETTSLTEVTEALRLASKDKRILGVVLNLEDMTSTGLATVSALGAAIDDYKSTSGRPVWVYGDSYTQAQYAVAAHADRVAIHPMGAVLLKGLSGAGLYWGDFLSHWGVGFTVYKAGAYKSAPESFTAGGPSDENLAVQKAQLDTAWGTLTGDIERARGMMPGSAARFAADFPKRLRDDALRPAVLLKEAGFVTDIMGRGDFDLALTEAFAGAGKKPSDLPAADYRDYLASRADEDMTEGAVAVVFAEGEISDVPEMGGVVAREFNMLLDDAASAPETRALVIRVNSPGGDAVAAETIRAKIEEIRESGIPVVVSMGDYAASGGYWISTAAEKIIAHPMTVTGSIGVFSLVPHAEDLLKRLRIGFEGYRTAPLADMGVVFRRPSEAEDALYQAGVSRTYAEFKRLTMEARGMDPDEVEKAAQGRIWFGTDAKRLGLVDGLGTLGDAVRLAASMAKLPEDAPAAYWLPEGDGIRAMLMSLLSEASAKAAGPAAAFLRSVPGESVLQKAVRTPGAPSAWSPVRVEP